MTLDAATREFVARAAQARTKPRHEMTPEEARAALSGLRELIGSGPPMRRIEQFEIPVVDASVPLRLFVPDQTLRALLVYLHGGGWVVGSIDDFDPLCREIADRTGCAVAAVGYRRAPEHPYPGPVDDVWSALGWVAENLETLAGANVPLLIGGDSAGGNLAIALTFRARAAGWPRLAGQLLIYPVTDCGMNTVSYADPDNQLMLTRDTMAWYWNHYAPDAARRSETEASPLRAVDLSGLPEAVVLTAGHDVLRDEGEHYVHRLRQAGVPTQHRRFDGQMHGFLMMGPLLPGSGAGLDYVGAAVGALLDRVAPRTCNKSEPSRP